MPPRLPPALKPFHPLVRDWFRERVGTPSAPQREGWPAIATGAHTLILAPTGTGKTETMVALLVNQVNALASDKKNRIAVVGWKQQPCFGGLDLLEFRQFSFSSGHHHFGAVGYARTAQVR